MKLTANLKSWAVANLDVEKDADDATFKKAISMALVEGDLTTEKFTELAEDEDTREANEFTKSFERLADSIDALVGNKGKEEPGDTDEEEVDDEKDGGGSMYCPKCKKGKMIMDPAKKMYKCKGCGYEMHEGKSTTPDEGEDGPSGNKGGQTDDKEFSGMAKMVGSMSIGTSWDDSDDGEKTVEVRVKEAAEQYSHNTKTALQYPSTTKAGRPHPMAGQPVYDDADDGRLLETTSQREKAVSGAYMKLLVATSRNGGSRKMAFQSLSSHDQQLIMYGLHKMEWAGYSGEAGAAPKAHGINEYRADIKGMLTPSQRKAIIDESGGSGGLEAVPIVFDDDVIQTPLLHGELYPLVKVKPLDRGRRVEGVSTGTVTGSWGGIDDTAISLFNTNSYISAFDTTVFRWEGAIQIGLDFLSDSPIDFGAHVTEQYGERLLEDLDDVVAAGNGTTQPEGVINKSGATSVTFGSATSLGNYESLRFGVAKPEHRSTVAASAVFCGTETSYQRARAIPVGASDARRIMGYDYSSYNWMERPYKINESLTNAQIFYAILARYRMYRRRGLTIRTSTEGQTLMLNNEMLIVAMARFGGQMERGACVAVTTDAPT